MKTNNIKTIGYPTFLTGVILTLTACGSTSDNASDAPIQGHVQSVHNQHVVYQHLEGEKFDTLTINGVKIPLVIDDNSEDGYTRHISPKNYQISSGSDSYRFGYYYDREKEIKHLFALAKPTETMPNVAGFSYMGDMIYQQSNDDKFAIYSFDITVTDDKRFKMSTVSYAKHLGEPETHLLPIEKATGDTNKDIEIKGRIKGNRLIGKVTQMKNTETGKAIPVKNSSVQGYFSGSNAETVSGVMSGKTPQFEFSGSFGGHQIQPVCAPGSHGC